MEEDYDHCKHYRDIDEIESVTVVVGRTDFDNYAEIAEAIVAQHHGLDEIEDRPLIIIL